MSNYLKNIDQLIKNADYLMSQSGFVFSDFSQLFNGFDQPEACYFFNSILTSVLDQALKNGKPAYSDQIHLVSRGDFNLSLVIAGDSHTEDSTVCASEFDMIVVNLSSDRLLVPVYKTNIDTENIFERPESLCEPVSQNLEPFKPVLFHAYHEIADLEHANNEAPCVVIHSLPRGSVTWVYDRSSRRPLNLTDNDLRRSRIQLAVKVLGETGTARYADTLEALATSDFDHFVRWEAAESVYKLDESRGIKLLEQHLVNDRNASLAKSAKATLASLNQEIADLSCEEEVLS